MYVSLGFLKDSSKLFDELPERNLVTWNVMITGLVKWGELEYARSLFEEMPCRNVVSWTGILDGYTRMNRSNGALALFRRMVAEITILAVLPAIWQNGAVRNCQLIHGYGEKRGFNAFDIRVSNCLIDTYAKCGCIFSALKLFEDISVERKNLVSWTSIISGFAMHGMGKAAVENFERMQKVGLKPNRVTFLSVLNACSHGGLVEEGLKFFDKMVEEAGRLEQAEKIALGIPSEITDVVVRRILLGACSFHGNVEMGERVTRKVLEMERGNGGDYVLMYNILAGVGRYVDAERLRRVMDERNALKFPGRSLAYIGKAPEMLLLPKFFQLVKSSLFFNFIEEASEKPMTEKYFAALRTARTIRSQLKKGTAPMQQIITSLSQAAEKEPQFTGLPFLLLMAWGAKINDDHVYLLRKDRRDTDIKIKKRLLKLYQIFLDITVKVEVKTLKHNRRSSRK
ncbi:pentatricopeptide repeat-containing protein [Citrus sinensis]|nr:pentatricopeptide repeat-containing protein [Citrus sinensis]